jgi:hypothetical protein
VLPAAAELRRQHLADGNPQRPEIFTEPADLGAADIVEVALGRTAITGFGSAPERPVSPWRK